MTAAYHPVSVPKPEKVRIIAISAVQMLFFGVQNKKILRTQYKLLPPYGTSFAALWPSTKVCCIF